IIGHSVDDATEKKAEVRKILWALLAAVFLHLLIGYGIATFSGVFSSPVVVEEDKPVELTIVDLSTPPPAVAKKNSMFMETDESKQSVEPPKEKTFESNANSIAASQQPATGDAPLPSQQGKDRPSVDLENHNYSLANQGAQPQPSAQPQQTPQPSEPPKSTPQPTPVDQFAMLTKTPAPTIQPSVAPTPAQVRSTYRPLKEKTRISGSISNRGISSVNALGTPLGRYEKILKDAIGSRWYAYMEQKRDLTSIGTLQVHFYIDRSGRVKNLKITENTSNEAFANVCLQSVLEAQLPAIPDDLANTLPSEGLEIEGMNFIIYPN
ncbi:MAG: energy transducer TonB, partial [Verrucomicrobiota bacterium]|nr:energy transducer TonB [Verrucomicrobiota bacterium]